MSEDNIISLVYRKDNNDKKIIIFGSEFVNTNKTIVKLYIMIKNIN